ncbi:CRISPR-associated protein Cas1 [Flexistipes sinusarabici DSM 4947]|uniref:CRISPR-associated endonuclease Cas1 n=1 Tax=Flexistipes sinusarabici (strain ATCC 49648 / DSM 4947 / MAS 10) TaxID=717231 RepID=F8E5B4_FLESM|nr:type I-B CRISPR-associated endonuclease Cas1b [Flexistipes sinusarabici]AEI14610.1 CRISPR-associated protein Cas1 [Flexistipes sinusarabici DSM 4947]
MRDYYIFKSGRISRKDNSVMFDYFDNGVAKKIPIPVNDIDSIFVFSETDFNTKLINFFSKNNVMIHFFNYYGYYTGTFYPKEFLNAGEVVVKQSEHYLNNSYRLELAQEFVKGAAHGMLQNLKRYQTYTFEQIDKIKLLISAIDEQYSVPSLMGVEGNIKEIYYSSFKKIIKQKIDFEKRIKNPPNNMMNAIISFMNGLIYSNVLREIYRTQLNPTISFLHEPWYRRFSLALDVAEIFKPIYGDRIIFDLLNNDELQPKHFDKDLNFAYLKEDGRKIVVKAFDEKMKKTVRHKQLKRDVSYRKFIRLELYKLIKHILNEKNYKSLRIWW